jgi:hypothetical protein
MLILDGDNNPEIGPLITTVHSSRMEETELLRPTSSRTADKGWSSRAFRVGREANVVYTIMLRNAKKCEANGRILYLDPSNGCYVGDACV